jgi:hypothetical protein
MSEILTNVERLHIALQGLIDKGISIDYVTPRMLVDAAGLNTGTSKSGLVEASRTLSHRKAMERFAK